MNDFGFYLIKTNPVVNYVKCAEAAVKASAKMIQLRMEHASRKKITGSNRDRGMADSSSQIIYSGKFGIVPYCREIIRCYLG